MRTIVVVAAIAVLCLAMLGAAREVRAAEEPAGPEVVEPEAVEPDAAETDAAEGDVSDADDPILAKVNGHPIRESDVERVYQKFGFTDAKGRETLPKERLIEELISRESARQFILASKIKVDDAEIDARWEEWKKRITTPRTMDDGTVKKTTVEEFLEQQHLTEEEIRDIYFVQIGIERLAESRITEEEIAALDELVRASHILVTVNDKVTDEEAQKKILFIKKEIEGGQAFEECAKVYSDCPSKNRGGDLGFFPRKARMVEPFAEAAYALKKGEISEPVKTRFGYHLILVTDRSTEQAKQTLHSTKVRAIIKEIQEKVTVERFYKETEEEEQEEGEEEEGPTEGGAEF